MPRLVFVYGTLRQGQRNDINRYRPAPRWVDNATIAGTLYHLGVYPGVVLGGAGTVLGEVYEIAPELEHQLDVLEGITQNASDEYLKREIAVSVHGRSQICLVYEINPSFIKDRPVISSGDWTAL